MWKQAILRLTINVLNNVEFIIFNLELVPGRVIPKTLENGINSFLLKKHRER